MTDHLVELFGANDFTPPRNAPCLPTPGATPLQIRDHADQWHPDHAYGRRDARKLCAGCPALNACLAANLHEPDGVWGGTTPDGRKRLRGEVDAA
jgi:hypothetical protein